MDLFKSELAISRSDDVHIDYDQNTHFTDRTSNNNLNIPKSTSLNFELYSSTRQLASAGLRQPSDENLKIQLVHANLEIERLTRRVQILDQDILAAKKLLEFNESKKNYQMMNDYAKKLEQILSKHKEASRRGSKISDKKDLQIQMLNGEIENLKKEITKQEGVIKESQKILNALNEEDSEYQDYKKLVIDFDPESVEKSILLKKLENLCQAAYTVEKKFNKQTNELQTKDSIIQGQRKDLIKVKAQLCTTEHDLKKLEAECKEKAHYIEEMDGHWSKQDNKLKEFDKFRSQTQKQVRIIKGLFKEINDCMLAVKAISVEVIAREKRKPVNTILMTKSNLFSNLGDSEEDEAGFNLLDVEFLDSKLSEMKEVKQALEILKLELGIKISHF